MYYNSIIDTIGYTPLIKMNNITEGIKGTVLAKVEYFNPGNSVKDRMALKMVEDAEQKGILKPGGTIIEGTSGNTGMGLAIIAAAKGYRCIFTTTDKQSSEKVDALKALGAEVIICPTSVPADDPRSYYSVASKIHQETPNSFYPNQYDNLSNTQAHYETTGPELWEETQGKITHFVAGVGTGGTMSGVMKYLREKNSAVHSVGIDSYGSVFKKYKETGIFDENEIYPYMTEGIGEDILPDNVDFSLIDRFIQVTDKDAAIMARRLAREEGLFVGWSSGAAVYGALQYARESLSEDDTMVILLPDHGTRYLKKIYNDNWMKDVGFLDYEAFSTAKDIIRNKQLTGENGKLITVMEDQKIGDVIPLLNRENISQVPVIDKDGQFVGSLTDYKVYKQLVENPSIREEPVKTIMGKPFQFVNMETNINKLTRMINKNNKALLVKDHKEEVHIITQADLLEAMSG